ncbi:hypothetical protein PHISP_05120 [Aspergillus sp. HF37]|nr:hypothetical protein PHISP_05120 [Aspergillus sp. HF37]
MEPERQASPERRRRLSHQACPGEALEKRLRALEVLPARFTELEQPLGQGTAGLAHRVLGNGICETEQPARHTFRRYRSRIPPHDNELAQSEAYSHGTQWVNYFLHMGHLSIQGSKMSKSLENFTTIREALDRGTWTSRSLRIVFLLGGWREGIEITQDMIKASNVWEERLTSFFLKVKGLPFSQQSSLQANSLATDDSLHESLAAAQNKVFGALCDSFNTPSAMAAIAELVTRFNIADSSNLSSDTVERVARWITSMVNILGLNGAAVPDSPEIGWSGIDIPEHAQPYLNAVSAIRDTLRQFAKSKMSSSPETLDGIPAVKAARALPLSDTTRPYADLLADVKERSATLIGADNDSKQILELCDHIRDVDLFDRGFYLEGQTNGPTIVRPVTQEMVRMRQEDAERDLQRQSERERGRQQETDKAKISRIPCPGPRNSALGITTGFPRRSR